MWEPLNKRFQFTTKLAATPPQNWLRPYYSCSSAPTALMTKLSTANLLSIHVLILRIFVFGGATRIVGAGSRQSQIGLCKGVLLANPLPGASGLGKLTKKIIWKCHCNESSYFRRRGQWTKGCARYKKMYEVYKYWNPQSVGLFLYETISQKFEMDEMTFLRM